MPRRDIAVAAVVARPAQDQRRHRSRRSDTRPRQAPPLPAPSIVSTLCRHRSRAARRRASLRRSGSGVGHRARLSAGWSRDATIRAGPRVGRRSRASSLSNKAKQVAPAPDIRDDVAPGCAEARPARSRSAAPARSRPPRGRCALAPVAERTPIVAVPAREHLGGRQRHARVHQQHRRAATPDRRAEARRPPPRPARAGSAGRPERRCRAPARRPSACAGSMPQAASASRSAAAASAEPPPMPEATGKPLVEPRAAPLRDPGRLAQAPAPPASPDCRRRAPSSAANGPMTSARARPPARRPAGLRRCRRRTPSRSMAPVGQLSAHVKREIELGRRDLRQLRSRRGVCRRQPGSILALAARQRRPPR